jgi:hypothetical protein
MRDPTTDSIAQILREMRVPLQAGSLVVPAMPLLALRETAPRFGRKMVYAGLNALFRGSKGISDAERVRLEARLTIYHETDAALERERQEVVRCLGAIPRDEAAAVPGRVLILFESLTPFVGRSFGVVRALQIAVGPGGSRIALLVEHEEALTVGFYTGVRAAQEYVRRRGGEEMGGVRFLSIEGQVIGPRVPLCGDSLGLSAAIGTLSSLLGVSAPADTAYTGAVDLSGRVRPVGGIPAKLAAAAARGIQRVFLPVANVADVPRDLPAGLSIEPVATLDAVAERAFTGQAFTAGVAQLRAAAVLPDLRPAYWIGGSEVAAGRPRILLTCVGKSDPFGHGKDQQGRSLDVQGEGAILTIVREYRPAAVHLFHTAAAVAANDFRGKAAEVTALLRELDPTMRVELIPLAVSDPTDYQQLVPAFEGECLRIMGEAGPDVAFLVNLTSGSSQMEVTWVVLADRGIPPATLLQVRESRFVRTGESRIRAVRLPGTRRPQTSGE